MNVLEIIVLVMVVTIVVTITLAATSYAAFRVRERRRPTPEQAEADAPMFFERVRFPALTERVAAETQGADALGLGLGAPTAPEEETLTAEVAGGGERQQPRPSA